MTAPPVMKAVLAVEPAEGGWRLTVNGRPATTPRRNPLVLPSRALAEAIAAEIRPDARRLAGRGLGDPEAAPNLQIALAAIDVVGAEPGARSRIEHDLAAYAGSDLVCYRATHPDELVALESAAWDPLCRWFAARFHAELAVTAGVLAPPQDDGIKAAAAALAARGDFELAALALATRAAGSVVIGLALAEGQIDAEAAYQAATVEERFQRARWGDDDDARRAARQRRLDLGHAAGFLALLAED